MPGRYHPGPEISGGARKLARTSGYKKKKTINECIFLLNLVKNWNQIRFSRSIILFNKEGHGEIWESETQAKASRAAAIWQYR